MRILADLTDISTQVHEGQSYNYWGDFVNMLLTLFFIIGLIFLSVWFLKRLMRTKLQNLNRQTAIKILERRALGPKSALYLVEVLGKGVVISETPSGIQLITEFSPDVNVSLLMEEMQPEAKTSFKETLAEKIKKLAGATKVKNE